MEAGFSVPLSHLGFVNLWSNCPNAVSILHQKAQKKFAHVCMYVCPNSLAHLIFAVTWTHDMTKQSGFVRLKAEWPKRVTPSSSLLWSLSWTDALSSSMLATDDAEQPRCWQAPSLEAGVGGGGPKLPVLWISVYHKGGLRGEWVPHSPVQISENLCLSGKAKKLVALVKLWKSYRNKNNLERKSTVVAVPSYLEENTCSFVFQLHFREKKSCCK